MYPLKNFGSNSFKTTESKISFSGLRCLVNYHRFCFVSYSGAQIEEYKPKKFIFIKVILIS
jgi:hypothetical protein